MEEQPYFLGHHNPAPSKETKVLSVYACWGKQWTINKLPKQVISYIIHDKDQNLHLSILYILILFQIVHLSIFYFLFQIMQLKLINEPA